MSLPPPESLTDPDALEDLADFLEDFLPQRLNPLGDIPGWNIDLEKAGFSDDWELYEWFMDQLKVGAKNRRKAGLPGYPGLGINDVAPKAASFNSPKRYRARAAALRVEQQTAEKVELGTTGKKDQLAELIASGWVLPDALNKLEIRESTYRKWKERDPHFVTQIDLAFAQRLRRRTTPEERPQDFLTKPDRHDFVGVRRYYFGYDTYEHHRTMVDLLNNTEPGELSMMLLPTGSGKTKLITDWICWRLGLDHTLRILYITETAGNGGVAAAVLGEVKNRLTLPDYIDPETQYPMRVGEFIDDFGQFRVELEDKKAGKVWNQSQIQLHDGPSGKDANLTAVGRNSAFYGLRADIIVIDDPQSAKSINETDAIVSTLTKTALTRGVVGAGSQAVYIGTRLGMEDAPRKFMDEGKVSRLITVPALNEEEESYCPEMYSKADLVGANYPTEIGGKRALLQDAWWPTQMQDPRGSEEATFTDIVDRALRTDLYAKARAPENHKVVIGVDTGLESWTALIAAAYNHEQFIVMDAVTKFGVGRNENVIEMIRGFLRYKPAEVVFEVNAAQRGIARDQRLLNLLDQHGVRMIEHDTGTNKLDVAFGVAAMASSFLDRSLKIPQGDNQSVETMAQLIRELESWRPNVKASQLRQDLVMSLWFCWLQWQREVQVLQSENDVWNDGGLPWDPDDMSGVWVDDRGKHYNPWSLAR